MLQWHHQKECEDIVILLGGFHVQMNFSKVIGQHLADSGLRDIFEESGVFMKGKGWNRVSRAHKLAFEALWRILWPTFLQWVDDNDCTIDNSCIQLADAISEHIRCEEIETAAGCYEELVLKVEKVQDLLAEFDKANKDKPTFTFWRQYMELVSILLAFTRALRSGDWKLYMSAFKSMMPWFAAYDHTHYTRWGAVFIADMEHLAQKAPQVYKGFLDGDFVAKETNHSFNNVPFDLCLEHINKTGKVAGGLVGITRNESARNRWSITYNERASLAQDTRSLFCLTHDGEDDEDTHKDCLPSRLRRDNVDVIQLVDQFQRYNVFGEETMHELVSLTTGDVASEEILKDLTNAAESGKQIVIELVKKRLSTMTIDFHSSLTKRNPKTFSHLYSEGNKLEKLRSKCVKPDRDIFRRIIVSMDRGKEVNIDELLQKELCAVPLSLATTDSFLRPTNKADLATILQAGAKETELCPSAVSSCIIIDGMALVRAIGKLPNASTFGDYADIFVQKVTGYLHGNITRVDLVFDQYKQNSIKGGTRAKRSTTRRKIRTIVRRDVKIPSDWNSFIKMDENKANLTQFLSNELERHVHHYGQEIVISGGFDHPEKVASAANTDVSQLQATHEEADTRILLHAVDATAKGYQRLIIQCRDTDVLVLLLVFAQRLSPEVWIKAGTAKKPCYIKVHEIKQPNDIINGLLAFHAITGCDTTSQFTRIGKKTAWKVFQQCPHLLQNFGEEEVPTPDTLCLAEQFVCKLYEPKSTSKSIHEVRCALFRKVKANVDTLPPTKDALSLHLMRAHYQTKIWKQSLVSSTVALTN
ncbi:hypothetical protein ACEWY4_023502 [Coilia grayii]|uniref:DUF6589 domain-containing protein n=1 Tax=Coilia grayii TaxID=363190 RepID=A0ABD1J379_9TELE